MRRLVLGVVGHVDHGKTALVRALTGMETDRLPEEKQRGISIALGFAHVALDGASIDLIDMPGHERFVRTMVSGATGIDAVLLVVAANEGVMPQTREHVHIAGLLGLRRAVVAVTKADLVSEAQAQAAGQEAARIAVAGGLGPGEPVLTSAAAGHGIEALRQAIGGLLHGAEARPDVGLPYLPVDRAFSLAGHGTVVTGTLRGGRIGAGEELDLVPSDQVVRVRGLQVHGRRVAQAEPGERVAVNLRGVELAQLGRGTALTARGALPASRWLTVQLRAVAGAPTLPTTGKLRLLFGTEEVDARLRLLDREALQPGETALAQLHCAAPVAVPAREHFILRSLSPVETVAGGSILDAQAVRLRRHAPGVLSRLAALAAADLPRIALLALQEAGPAGVAIDRLARLAGVSQALAAATLHAAGTVLCGGKLAVAQATFDALLDRLAAALAQHDAPRPRDHLLASLPGTAAPVLDAAIARLVKGGTVRQAPGGVALIRADRDREQTRSEQDLADRLAAQLRQGGLTPPDAYAIAPDPHSRRILERLVREGVAVRAHDSGQKRDVVFHQDAIDLAQRRLAPLLAEGPGLLVKEIGAALGISRKFSVPLLDHLDSLRFTRRTGDRRQLAPR